MRNHLQTLMQATCRARVRFGRASEKPRKRLASRQPRATTRHVLNKAVVNKSGRKYAPRRNSRGTLVSRRPTTLLSPTGRRTPPIAEHDEAADQTAEMREMRDAFLRAGDAEKELEHRVDDDEDARRHWDRREDQHDPAMRKIDGVGEQQTEDAARGSNRGIDRSCNRGSQKLGKRRGHDADEVIRQIAPRPKYALHRAAEHVQREHVERDVYEAAVEERIRQKLPRLEARGHRTHGGGRQ